MLGPSLFFTALIIALSRYLQREPMHYSPVVLSETFTGTGRVNKAARVTLASRSSWRKNASSSVVELLSYLGLDTRLQALVL